jgi:hypothetical protein
MTRAMMVGSPFQGWMGFVARIPRALPWAVVGCAVGAKPRVRRAANRADVAARARLRLRREDLFDGLGYHHASPNGADHVSPGQRPGNRTQISPALSGRSKPPKPILHVRAMMIRPPFQGWGGFCDRTPRALPWAGIKRAVGAKTRVRLIRNRAGVDARARFGLRREDLFVGFGYHHASPDGASHVSPGQRPGNSAK